MASGVGGLRFAGRTFLLPPGGRGTASTSRRRAGGSYGCGRARRRAGARPGRRTSGSAPARSWAPRCGQLAEQHADAVTLADALLGADLPAGDALDVDADQLALVAAAVELEL